MNIHAPTLAVAAPTVLCSGYGPGTAHRTSEILIKINCYS